MRNYEVLEAIQTELSAADEYAAAMKIATNDEEYHAQLHGLWWANNRVTQLLEKLMALEV